MWYDLIYTRPFLAHFKSYYVGQTTTVRDMKAIVEISSMITSIGIAVTTAGEIMFLFDLYTVKLDLVVG